MVEENGKGRISVVHEVILTKSTFEAIVQGRMRAVVVTPPSVPASTGDRFVFSCIEYPDRKENAVATFACPVSLETGGVIHTGHVISFRLERERERAARRNYELRRLNDKVGYLSAVAREMRAQCFIMTDLLGFAREYVQRTLPDDDPRKVLRRKIIDKFDRLFPNYRMTDEEEAHG